MDFQELLIKLAMFVEKIFPYVIMFLVAVFLVWLIATVFSYISYRLLRNAGFDKIGSKKITKGFEKIQELSASKVVSRFVFWLVVLIVLLSTFHLTGFTMISPLVSSLIIYLPQLLLALLILFVGYYIARLMREGLSPMLQRAGVESYRMLSNGAYYLLLTIVVLAALDQAGVDTSFLNLVLIILLAAVALAFAIAFGLGAKDILGNILSSFYSGGHFRVGQRIAIDTVEGTIEGIDATSCSIRTEKGLVVLPVKKLLTEQVIIKDN